jgi:hypothetical protein
MRCKIESIVTTQAISLPKCQGEFEASLKLIYSWRVKTDWKLIEPNDFCKFRIMDALSFGVCAIRIKELEAAL